MLFKREWSKTELLRRVGQMDQLAGVRLLETLDGKARGCRVLDVWTGSGLRFQVNAERALDISSCDFRGQSLAWRSPAGDVHPAFYEPQGLGWLRSFPGGLLATCGLDQFGSPSQEGGAEFGLHGRISNSPASQVSYRTFWDGDEYKLEISGETRQAELFCENLVLRRKISTALGSNCIRIEDVVTNAGFQPAPHMLLYHFNLGFPLVSEKTCLQLQSEETLPRDATAQRGLVDWERFQAPTPGYAEQVFIHKPMAAENGLTTVKLRNPPLGLGLRWTYKTAELPYLMEWKMMGEGVYVVGVEPANCKGLGGRAATREAGQLPILAPGESRSYQIEVEVISE
ncbi:MAG: aldose 1-epimerase family protein [Anaerolineaceae bacterium]|nr:aldose 1-epimerase family protein [Anaerolineaceae bacterium]